MAAGTIRRCAGSAPKVKKAASVSRRAAVNRVLSSARAPKRKLSRDAEQALTPRQLEILDALEDWVLRGGVADVTIAAIAKRMGCSLRTLYGIAPSKDELVLIVLDRRLHRIGRDAATALDAKGTPLARLRAYLRATNLAVQPTTAAFSRDFARVPGARQLNDAHTDYIVAITRNLLNQAIAEGEIDKVNVPAVAHVLGRLGNEFALETATDMTSGSAEATANGVADLILHGLEAGTSSD